MQEKKYLFYDLETTGSNKSFDQIIQFAGIVTDQWFNELEKHNFYIKLNPDVLPTPDAAIVHEIPIEKLMREGISEYQAVRKIFNLFNTSNTISIGYNSIRFDNEFLRFLFHKNLFPPYEHQYKRGCYRVDIYPMLIVYFLLRPDVISWPFNNDKVSLKLESINKLNNLYKGRSHDALTDVQISIFLVKKLWNYDKNLWNYLLLHFLKIEDNEFLSKLDIGLSINEKKYRQGIVCSDIFGAKNFFISPVLNLGQHRYYKNKICLLRLDYQNIKDINLNNISEHKICFYKKIGDLPLMLPAKNNFTKYLNSVRQKDIKSNKSYLLSHPSFFEEIKQHFLCNKYEKINNIDVDAALYQDDFSNYGEYVLLKKFHQADFEFKKKLMSHMNDSCYKRALRILGRIDMYNLDFEMLEVFEQYIKNISSEKSELIDHNGVPRLSISDTLQRINLLKEDRDLSSKKINILKELESYILDVFVNK